MAPAVHGATPPANLNVDNGAAITTGVGFHVNATKSIAGVSFYVPTTNTGTYTVGLYQSTSDDSSGTGAGTLLASASIGSAFVTAGTWADVLFSSPVSVNSGQMYRAARHASSGRYVSTSGTFTSAGMTANGITFNQTGTDPVGSGTFRNGMFSQNASMTYPNQTFGAADYFVDVVLASSSNDAVVANSLPSLTGSLTGDQQYDGVVANALPALAGTLTADEQYTATIANALPSLAGSLAMDQPIDAVISGSLPAVSGTLTGDQQYLTTVGGSLPAVAGSVTGDQQTDAVLSGNLPALVGTLTGESPTDATISGSLPTLAGVVMGDALTDAVVPGAFPSLAGTLLMDAGPSTLDMVLSGSLPSLYGWLTMGNDAPPVINVDLEVKMNRRVTKAFIDANPSDVTLVPRNRYRTGTGAWKYQRGEPRVMQVMRLIEQGPPEILTTADGVQRTLDYVLLAEWNAVLEPNDVFEYDGDLLEVLEVYHDNSYEVRAAVTRKLDPP